MDLNHEPFAVKLRGSGWEGKAGEFYLHLQIPPEQHDEALWVSSVDSAQVGPTYVPQEHVLHQPYSTWCLVFVSPCENTCALYREIWLLHPLKKTTSKEDAVPSSPIQSDWLWFMLVFIWAEKAGMCGGASLSVYLEIIFDGKLHSLSQQVFSPLLCFFAVEHLLFSLV